MNYKIQKANLNWRNTGWVKLNPNAVEGITLHHMAHPTADLPTVHKWHLDRWAGEPGCGYNYWISLTGEIFEARGDHRGAHVGGKNSSLVGIGFQGNYEPINGVAHRTSMPDAQYNAGVWLIKELQKKYPRARVVHGHKHWTATSCPGRFFPLIELLAGKFRGQVQPVQTTTPTTTPTTTAGTYTVKAGDSLSRIAAAHNTTSEELAQLNKISNPNLIRVGQVLTLPDQLKAAIDILAKAGVINSPDFWIENARPGKTVNGDSAGQLILKAAEKIRG